MASDTRRAKYVLWSNFVLILWKLFGLFLFGFLVWQLVWARNRIGRFCFCDAMQLERALFTTKYFGGGGGGGVLGSIFAGYVPLPF